MLAGIVAASFVVPARSRSLKCLQTSPPLLPPLTTYPRRYGVTASAVSSASGIVTLTYDELIHRNHNLGDRISQAFGEGGLGLLTVAGVPGYLEQRAALLPLAQQLASLPEDALARLEDPESHFSFGWSCGKETLQDGRPDYFKGSFYANPTVDKVTDDLSLMALHPSYCRPNIWPVQDLPALEPAFKALGATIVHVGTLVARQCDLFLTSRLGTSCDGSGFTRQEPLIANSRNSKGRLLHYFPHGSPRMATLRGGVNAGDPGSWCGWHTDHGSLTGLAGALFLDPEGNEVANPDPEHAGLHVRTRRGDVVRVVIPQGHVAFQVGEAMQVHSGGLLQATPHYVAAPKGAAAARISRNTFAVFMQPQWDEPMEPPRVVREGGVESLRRVGVGQWREGLTFGEFTNLTLNMYYG
eukprot:jgi/Mesvir1/18548/Mv17066-RA.1